MPRPAPAVRRIGGAARQRAVSAGERVRMSLWPVLQAAVAAGSAYWLARELFGHANPFFAAIAAFVSVGLTDDRRLRRVGELALGVTLGVGIGDLVVLWLGSGPVQIAAVLAGTVLLARLLGGSHMLTTQAGVQALLVVALPPQAGGPFARWQDAFVGGATALVVAVLLPADPRRLLRRRTADLVGELAEVLEDLAATLRRGDPVAADRVLHRARSTSPVVEDASSAVRGAREVTRTSPLRRTHRGEVARLAGVVEDCDRAVRNARVVARRAVHELEDRQPQPEVAALVADLAHGARRLRNAVAAGTTTGPAQPVLQDVAARLAPGGPGGENPAAAALVLLLRPLVVDLLEATGMAPAHAQACLAGG